jgi:hypothetical protein
MPHRRNGWRFSADEDEIDTGLADCAAGFLNLRYPRAPLW